MSNQNIVQLIRQIAKQQGLSERQTAVLIAGAKVESSLDPGAVGDNGTSYGLYQMHVGGAGGSTHESARRYLDPATAIRNRARFVREQNITDGAGFAALQRPADPSGYAAKVNAALKGVRGGGTLNAPVTSSGGATLGLGAELPGLPAADPFAARLSGLASVRSRLADDGASQEDGGARGLRGSTASLRSARQAFTAPPPAAPVSAAVDQPAQSAQSNQPVSGPNPSADGVGSYKDILALGKKFGLRIDGSNQTTGGTHSPTSWHYKGRAVDFGDAKNSPEKLRALSMWAKRNAPRVKELFYDPLGFYIKNGKIIKGSIGGHGDHVHLAM
jgi:hypothetical protein